MSTGPLPDRTWNERSRLRWFFIEHYGVEENTADANRAYQEFEAGWDAANADRLAGAQQAPLPDPPDALVYQTERSVSESSSAQALRALVDAASAVVSGWRDKPFHVGGPIEKLLAPALAAVEAPEPAEQKASQADSRSDSVDSTERSVSESTSAQALRPCRHFERLPARDTFDAEDNPIEAWVCWVPVGAHPNDTINRRIERLQSAIEGECDGLAIDRAHAALILQYVDENAADHHGASEPDEKGEGRCARALAELVAVNEPNFQPFKVYQARYQAAWAEARAAVEALKSDEGDLGVTLRGGAKTTGDPR